MNRPSTILGHLKPLALADAIASMMDTFHDDISEDHQAELVIEIHDAVKILMNTVGYEDAVEYVEEADMFPINQRYTWTNYMKKIDMGR